MITRKLSCSHASHILHNAFMDSPQLMPSVPLPEDLSIIIILEYSPHTIKTHPTPHTPKA
jgi:hypothetical protein